ncbi:MAG: type IIL restriction-modification enzyme MmeI [Rhodovibrio sp.]|nr:type IIL restriction-modification enzyme MmeI [Rhodovibrio sp.]
MTVSQTPTHADPDSFIARWAPSGGQESANYQLFLTELCDLLGLPHPDPAIEETRENAYVFERRVEFDNGDGTRSSGWIDLYKRGCFVLEAKQSAKPERQRLVARQGSRAAGTARRGGRGWDDAMRNAFGQARYRCESPRAVIIHAVSLGVHEKGSRDLNG